MNLREIKDRALARLGDYLDVSVKRKKWSKGFFPDFQIFGKMRNSSLISSNRKYWNQVSFRERSRSMEEMTSVLDMLSRRCL